MPVSAARGVLARSSTVSLVVAALGAAAGGRSVGAQGVPVAGTAVTAAARDTTARRPEPGSPEAESFVARQLQNPVSAVSALPLPSSFDYEIGEAFGYRFTLDAERVASRRVSARWRVVSRTRLPIVAQRDVAGGSGGQSGLGDLLQTTLVAPARWAPRRAGPAWGIGTALRAPTATDSLLGTRRWSAGPAGAVVLERGAWTLGTGARHLWSFAGPRSRPHVNATTLQPFLWRTTATALAVGSTADVTYDWAAERWRSVVDVGGAQVITVNRRSASIGLFVRSFPGGDESLPRWGVRFVVTLVFPRPD